jgi:hypothetical protein
MGSFFAFLLKNFALGLACGTALLVPDLSIAAESSSSAGEQVISSEAVETRVAELIKSLNPGSGMSWSPALTPVLPLAWPPKKDTHWVRYGYARGQEFPPGRIADGEHVAKPWLRIELLPASRQARLHKLSELLESAGIQGVRPLMPPESSLLSKAELLQSFAMGLTALPAETDPRVSELKKYYQLWLQTNGVIADQIRNSHRAFLDWVQS